MPAVFPTLSFGQVCMYPVTRAIQSKTSVHKFINGREQRYCSAAVLNSWTLGFEGLDFADVLTLEAFNDTVKGSFDSTWTFPFDGTSYTDCVFETDSMEFTEKDPKVFAAELKIRQTVKSGSYSTGVAAVYPTINGGVITQRPFGRSDNWRTGKNKLDSGPQYAWTYLSAPLYRWVLSYPVISMSEFVTLLNFFTSMRGRWQEFTFTDPQDASVHIHCRLDVDQIEAKMVDPGYVSTSLIVSEYVN